MPQPGTPADPPPRGAVARARQSVGDLFHWRNRVRITGPDGESRYEWQNPAPFENPFAVLRELTLMNWLAFLLGFFSWTADAFDFHALSIQQVKIAKYYGTTKTVISTAITLTLLLRSVGSIIFGMIGDKWGRKWPLVVNMIILGLLQIGTIYARNVGEFIAVRALFGLFMGGVYGNAISISLESCPVKARGVISGFLQEGYGTGYILAACVNLGVGGATNTWKTPFWVGAGFSILMGILRIFFPESPQFLEAKKAGQNKASFSSFWLATKTMMKQEWRIVVYTVVLTTWFNYLSHVSQDNYTTMMLVQKELNSDNSLRASLLMKTGGFVGGVTIGHMSELLGRRRSMIVSMLIGCILIPAWILPNSAKGLYAGGFMMQLFITGPWGVMPIHLTEIAPTGFRSTFVGTTYQLGNAISSPSTQIINAIAEKNLISTPSGLKRVQAYGPTMAIATAIVSVGAMLTLAVGPEYKGARYDLAPVAGQVEENARRGSLEKTEVEQHEVKPSKAEEKV